MNHGAYEAHEVGRTKGAIRSEIRVCMLGFGHPVKGLLTLASPPLQEERVIVMSCNPGFALRAAPWATKISPVSGFGAVGAQAINGLNRN